MIVMMNLKIRKRKKNHGIGKMKVIVATKHISDEKYHKISEVISGIFYLECGGTASETISKHTADERNLDKCEVCFE